MVVAMFDYLVRGRVLGRNNATNNYQTLQVRHSDPRTWDVWRRLTMFGDPDNWENRRTNGLQKGPETVWNEERESKLERSRARIPPGRNPEIRLVSPERNGHEAKD